MFQKFKSLSVLKKFGLGLAALTVIGIIGSANQPPKANLDVQNTSSTGVLGSHTTTDTPKKKAPVVTTKTETETQPVPFTSTTVNTSSLPKGQTKVTTAGVNGVSTLTYKVTYTDGKQTSKELVSQVATTQPVTQVTSVGTYVAPKPVAQAPTPSSSCDPNYSGGCVPNVYPADVDCAGGSGNGPYYVRGPVHVVGVDRYGLDANHDGIACQ